MLRHDPKISVRVTVTLVPLHGNVRYVIQTVIHAKVFRRWEQRLHVTSTAHLNAGHPWTVQTSANEDVITVVVE
jgi:hypothetical protein